MIEFIKTHKRDILLWILLIIGFLATRLVRLGLIPIFTDEAIYLRWSQILSGDLKYIYLPLTDGKPPLFMWLVAVFMKLLPGTDPLITGRLVSVLSGLAALAGIYFTSWQLLRNKFISYLSSIFYLLSSFTFFYDRFALADSMLAMWGVWSLGLGVVVLRTLWWRWAVVLGIILGLGWLTKTPAEFFIVLLPILVILKPKSIGKYALLILLSAVIARGIYSLLFLLPQAYVINLKSYEFIVPFSELIKHPLQFFVGNFKGLATWEIQYLTWPLVGLIIISLIKISRPKIILLAYFFSLFVFMLLFNKVIYPRFLLTFTPMLLILAAAGTAEFKKLAPVVLILALILPIYTNYKLLTDPVQAPIADTDSAQYLNSWSAGWGLREINSFFAGKNTTVGVEGTFGLMPYALELYQKDHPNLTIKPYWPAPEILPAGLDYFIVYQRPAAPAGWKVRLIAQYFDGYGKDSLKLYKIEP
ncbi:glycosyltransferase family 39 protein [Patescibacteria group bacterium]|nr:glycosyltransferase family 39 protein [Patescibacteria group bacterium]